METLINSEVETNRLKRNGHVATRKVFIAVPIFWDVDPLFFKCALKLQQDLNTQGIHGVFSPYCGDSAVGRARNVLTRWFLDSDCTHLLFVDSDLVFGVDQIKRILNHGEPIVGGIYCKKQEGPVQMVMNGLEGPDNQESRDDGLLRVKYVGTGFICTAREVFERMIEVYGDDIGYRSDSDHKTQEWDFWQMGVYKYPDGSKRWLSEDWYFPVDPSTPVLCNDWKWRQIGELKVGDRLMAFDEESPAHSSRRFESAKVLEVIDRELPKWKITHEEGTIVTTADHPWLVKRMWRKPNGFQKDNQNLESPCKWIWTKTSSIKPGDYLSSVVEPVTNPDTDHPDYLSGYIQGLFQSDGTISEKHSQAVVRMKDLGPLNRLEEAFRFHGIRCTRTTPFHDGNKNHSVMHGLGVYRKESLAKLIGIVRMDEIPNPIFASGYLAGMYDGDGSHSGGDLTIANLKEWKLSRMIECGNMVGIQFKVRGDKRCVRLTGIQNVHKFWMLTLPANSRRLIPLGQPGNDGVTRMCETRNRPVRVVSVEDTGITGHVRCISTTTKTFIANGFASHNCQRAIDLGYKIYADRGTVLKHSGHATYPLSYQEKELFRPDRRLEQFESVEGCEAGISEVFSGQYDFKVRFDFPPRIIDIGANVGAFAAWADWRWPGCTTTCYEPNPKVFPVLQRNCDRLKSTAINAAIGDVSLNRLFPGKATPLNCSQYKNNGHEGQPVEITVIDPSDLGDCDLMKIDAEGAEAFIVERLLNLPSYLMVEYHSAENHERIIEYLIGKMALMDDRPERPGYGVMAFRKV